MDYYLGLLFLDLKGITDPGYAIHVLSSSTNSRPIERRCLSLMLIKDRVRRLALNDRQQVITAVLPR